MKYTKLKPAILVLADGTVFKGNAIGKIGTAGGELCFNTGMTGYQEIYTDPSYHGQLLVHTLTHIGNYGTLPSEEESDQVQIAGLICDKFSSVYSRMQAHQSLHDWMIVKGLSGISNLDTRQIVRHIRSKGAMNAIVSSEELNSDVLLEQLKQVPPMLNLELASRVSTKESYINKAENPEFKIAVLDLGIKKAMLHQMAERGIEAHVFPAKTSFQEMEAINPDGYFISNGPGDPASTTYATETIKEILAAEKPLFGICMGHQLLAQANGVSTYKMHHGHRGLNHPVLNLLTERSEITSQNHGFAVNADEVRNHPNLEITHTNLNDGTVEGIRVKNKPAFSVQYHPESSPGPHDSRYLFDQFKELMLSCK
jgi:carbamoyl-phosphate synthase small subunit